jgi:hypothetical protein
VVPSFVADESVPYYEAFGSSTTSITDNWNAWSNIVGSVAITNADPLVGTHHLDVKAGGVELTVNDSGASNVFVQMYVKAAACPDIPSVDQTLAAGICLYDDTQTNFLIQSSNGWEGANQMLLLPDGIMQGTEYLGIALHMNYTDKEFLVYCSTSGNFATHMQLADSRLLPFGASHSGETFSSLIVTQENASVGGLIDAVAIANSLEPLSTSAVNLEAALRNQGTARSIAMPPYNYGANDTFASDMGDDLLLSLALNDEIQIINEDNWNVFRVAAGPVWQHISGSYTVNTQINPAHPMILVRQAGDDDMAFYPYADATTPIIAVTVIDTNNAVLGGRTPMAMPATEEDCVDINADQNLGFEGLASNGDEIRFYDADTGVGVNFYWRDGDWYDGASVASYTVCPGDTWLYYRRSTGGFSWDGI